MNNRVLVLDGDVLPALAIVRSLGRQGISVDVASHLKKSICSYSKYVVDVKCCPHPLRETNAFTSWIEKILDSNLYHLIIPCTERTLVPISNRYGNTKYAASICMPDKFALETVLDKSKTSKLATALNIPQPQSWHVETMGELEKYRQALSYPLVIKPGRSIAGSGQRTPLTVQYAHNEEELRSICEEMLRHVHVVLQKYFRGTGVGIELIARHGEILYAFQHQRLHEMPLSGGGSSYRKSVALDPALLAAGRKLITHLKWHGVAMVEFKRNAESGAFILIEINGRFWGSLPLAIAAGADFPYLLYQLYTAESVSTPPPYRIGIKCRKLSSDINWFEAVVRKDADQRLVIIPSVKSALGDALDIFSPKHYFDAQCLSDLKPGLADLLDIASAYIKRLNGLIVERKEHRELLKKSHYSIIQRQAKLSRNILFVCYGNINRSAVAYAMASVLFKDSTEITFKSAGFHPVGNRPADHRMVVIAEENSVPMKGFTSSIFTPELSKWADIIFVMETSQLSQAAQISLDAEDKTFLLGGLTSKRNAVEIADPYNQIKAKYVEAYNQVHKAVLHLRELIP